MTTKDLLKVNLLSNYATTLNGDTHAKLLLKSHYLTTCKKIVKQQPQMQLTNLNVSQICPRCSCFWSENDYKLKLRPQKVGMNGKTKKLIAKLEASKTGEKPFHNKKQKKRAKWLQKRCTSNIDIVCEFCHETSHIPLVKVDNTKSVAIKNKNLESIEIKTPKKKKLKKKDKTAGLKIVEPTVCKRVTEIYANEQKKSNITTTKTKKIAGHLEKKKIDNNNTKKTNNTNISTTLKSKKSKKKKSITTTAPVGQKIQSKTQQQNSLLQLAALLKNQSSKSNNTPQNRLASLLK